MIPFLLNNTTNTLGQFLTIAATSVAPMEASIQKQESVAPLSYTYSKIINYEAMLKTKNKTQSDSDIVEDFISKIMNDSIELAPEFAKIIEENYWDLF